MNTTICTAQQAREADRKAIEKAKIPSLILMEHAAQKITGIILSMIDPHARIVIVCGPGNNGGDGMAVARLLHDRGILPAVSVPSSLSHDEAIQLEMLKHTGCTLLTEEEDILSALKNADLIVDALFGNGLSRAVEGLYQTLIEAINEAKADVVAVDIASGIHADTGHILNAAVKADVTVALDCMKPGHLINEGKLYAGKITCVDIGIPRKDHEHTALLIDEGMARTFLPKRSNHSHKGTFGKGLIVGGSYGMPGALLMAAAACYQSGIGTLTLMIPECIYTVVSLKTDFAMKLPAPCKDGLFDEKAVSLLDAQKDRYDIIAIGNGISQNKTSAHLVKSALESEACVLVDADACRALQNQTGLLKRSAPTILTPHLKEMSYLCQKDIKAIREDPFHTVKEFCKMYPHCTLVLKSDVTIIGSGDELLVLNRPDSTLAKGGSGDILCGMITGLYGQSRHPFESAACGVWLHSQLAKTVKKDPASTLPQDLLDQIPVCFQALRNSA